MRILLVLAVLPLLAGSESRSTRPPRLEEKRFRLELEVPDQSGIYFTAWADGDGDSSDAIVPHDGSDGKVVRFIRWFVWLDGCTREASETVTPTSARTYDYAYRERPLKCPAGTSHDPGAPTPRDGKVKAFPVDARTPLTPERAWAKNWDTARN
ncbi:MAG: hypothetical protein WKG01_16795 [Kofleriaceae bacterium]